MTEMLLAHKVCAANDASGSEGEPGGSYQRGQVVGTFGKYSVIVVQGEVTGNDALAVQSPPNEGQESR